MQQRMPPEVLQTLIAPVFSLGQLRTESHQTPIGIKLAAMLCDRPGGLCHPRETSHLKSSKEEQPFRKIPVDAAYAAGRDVVIERRSANGDYDRVPALAVDLVQREFAVIVTDTTLEPRLSRAPRPLFP